LDDLPESRRLSAQRGVKAASGKPRVVTQTPWGED
jgi:hypothetical protein